MTELNVALKDLQQAVLDTDEPRELAKYLLSLQKVRTQLGEIIDECHAQLARRLEKREVDLGPGIGFVKRIRDSRTSWNHEEVFNLVLDQHKQINPDTGEVEINGFELANSLRELVAFAYWRKTALRERKIDYSEYCTEVYGQPRVRFLSKEGS